MSCNNISEFETYEEYDVNKIIQKQQLKRLQKQILERDKLLDGLESGIIRGFHYMSGTVFVYWKEPSDGDTLNRYLKYY